MDYVCTAIPEGTAIVTVTDGTVTLRTPAARAAAAAPPANAAAGGRGQLLQQAAQQPAGLGKAAVEEWAPIGLSALIDGLCLALLDAPPHGLLAPPRPPAPSLGGAEAQRGGQPLSAEGRPWPPKAWEGARRAAEAAVAARERLKRPPSSAAPLSAVASAASLPDVPGAENGSGLANGSVSDGIANGVANGTAKDGGSGGAEGGGCASLGYAHRSTGSGASLASSSSSAPSDAPSLGLCAGALGGAAPTSVRAFMRAFASWVHMQPSPVTVLAGGSNRAAPGTPPCLPLWPSRCRACLVASPPAPTLTAALPTDCAPPVPHPCPPCRALLPACRCGDRAAAASVLRGAQTRATRFSRWRT